MMGEANYYKAAAFMASTPPEAARAIVPARAARKAGYPNAEALLRQAEEQCRAGEGG
jgi:hypothetical protein